MTKVAPVSSVAPNSWSLPSGPQLLVQSWKLVRARIGVLVGVISIAISLVILATVGIGMNVVDFKSWSLGALFASITFLVLSISFIKTWVDIALVSVVVSPEKRLGVRGAFRATLKLVLPYWWVSIIIGLITVGGLIPLIIPGIIFATWFGFTQLLVVTDDLRGFRALAASRSYARGFVLSILSRELFLGIVLLLALSPFWIIGLMMKATWIKEASEVALFVLSPLVLAYKFLLLSSLRERPGVQLLDQIKMSKGWFLILIWGLILPILMALIPLFFLSQLYHLYSTPLTSSLIR